VSSERKQAVDRAYYLANKEKIMADVKAWQAANRAKARSYKATWKRNNPGCWKRDAKASARASAWTKRNPEKHRDHVQAWRKRTPDLQTSYIHKRRAKKLNAHGGHFTGPEWAALKERWGNVCLSCRKRRMLTPDHVIPLCDGGSDGIDNIQPLCRNCNSRKWRRHTDYRSLVRAA
jgi:5-methylcytosine-specific restriction endonuclease McrA